MKIHHELPLVLWIDSQFLKAVQGKLQLLYRQESDQVPRVSGYDCDCKDPVTRNQHSGRRPHWRFWSACN